MYAACAIHADKISYNILFELAYADPWRPKENKWNPGGCMARKILFPHFIPRITHGTACYFALLLLLTVNTRFLLLNCFILDNFT